MQKEFSLSNDKVMINFTVKYCDSHEKILNSDGFKRVLKSYLDKIQSRQSRIYEYVCRSLNQNNTNDMNRSLTALFKLLTTFKAEDIIKINCQYFIILEDREKLSELVEDFYKYWRRLERYTIICNTRVAEGFERTSFIDANAEFSKLILSLYRKIKDNILGYEPNVYRQLPAGGNAGIILNLIEKDYTGDYSVLNKIPFIDKILLDPPFITYPKKNTRNGYFTEVFDNPLKECSINPDHWFCYPAKVGLLTAFIYFHRDFMSHGIALCNLFEMANKEEYINKKPDIMYVLGARDSLSETRTVFYDDKDNNIMFGYVNYSDEIDYFGYMKKMTLTLHNLIMIKNKCLPIHGAMVNVVLKTGKKANIILVGDSGAGKSETIEAFRKLGDKYISDMSIIFDDMGVLKLKDGKITAYGTEVGAFVRLDDLDSGYAFKELDRSIFMNPDKINARLVIPISSYSEITHGYGVDMFLYANNYEEVSSGKPEFQKIENMESAIQVFRDGARYAKGTTQEKGLVKSYFANPFGPYQRQKETDILLEEYFSKMYNSGIIVGQLRTCLGVSGKEKEGPSKAALKLFETINS